MSSPTPYWTSATSTGILLATSGPYVERIFQVRPSGGIALGQALWSLMLGAQARWDGRRAWSPARLR